MAGVLPEYIGEWATEKIKAEGVTVVPRSELLTNINNRILICI